MPREWDATTYDALTLPHEKWGRLVLGRMLLVGDERVLDAGCGTGRDAAALRERWPGVRLVELDGSQQMLDVARGRLGDDGVTYVHADLMQPLPLNETSSRPTSRRWCSAPGSTRCPPTTTRRSCARCASR